MSSYGRTRPLLTILLAILIVAQFVPTMVGSASSTLLTINLACVYAIAAIGLNIVFGMGGLLSIAQAALMAIGGYTLIILFGDQFPLIPALLLACVMGAAVSASMGLLAARVKSHYFVLVSFALAEIIVLLITNSTGFTGGATGMALKDSPMTVGLDLTLPAHFFHFASVCVIATVYFADSLRASRIGAALNAMTADEYLSLAAGVSSLKARLVATGVGGAFAGLAGGLLGVLDGYLGPQNFSLNTAILLLLIVVVAGRARSGSVVVAAVALTFLSQGFLTLAAAGAMVYGLGLIVLIIVAPDGLSAIARSISQRVAGLRLNTTRAKG